MEIDQIIKESQGKKRTNHVAKKWFIHAVKGGDFVACPACKRFVPESSWFRHKAQ